MNNVLDASLRAVLDALSDVEPPPGGGWVAAGVVAMAAALVETVARASRGAWPGAAGAAGQAEALRARVTPLARADAEAYREALSVMRGESASEPRYHEQELAAALDRAAAIPLEIAETGTDVALLAALVVEHGNPQVRADAAVAAALAEGGCRAAAKLVAVNLASTDDDARTRHAKQLVEDAANAARRALAAAE